MQNELTCLIKLQEFDSAIDGLVERIQTTEASIQEKNKQADAFKASLKNAKDSLMAQQLKKKQLESEAEAKEQLIKKHQGELNSLKSNDAYKAMLGEIEQAKEALKKIEDDILGVMESLDSLDKDLKMKEQKIKADENAVRAEAKTLEAEKGKLSDEEKIKRAERDAFAATVPDHLKSHYEAIHAKRGGIVIVPVVNNTCGGCRLNLTPNKANEVKKGKTMVLCDSCLRILYTPAPVEAVPVFSPTPPPAVPS